MLYIHSAALNARSHTHPLIRTRLKATLFNAGPTYWTLVENFILVPALCSFHCYVLTQTSVDAESQRQAVLQALSLLEAPRRRVDV